MYGSPDFRDPDEIRENDQSIKMCKIESTMQTIQTLVDAMGSRRSWREVREIHRATEMAGELIDSIRQQTPEQFADMAATELGLI